MRGVHCGVLPVTARRLQQLGKRVGFVLNRAALTSQSFCRTVGDASPSLTITRTGLPLEHTSFMFFESPEIQFVLDRIINRVNTDPAWHDDLMQEALIHLWQLEQARPHQRPSWYLQSCHFHLRHYMDSGRSVDSWKRREWLVSTSAQEDTPESERSLTDHSTSLEISEYHAHEMLALLRQRLTPPQKQVLGLLVQGLSSREIGSRLGVSHNAVSKHRRRIAKTAGELGMRSPQP